MALAERDYAKAILRWEKRTGKGPLDLADLIAEELVDKAGRVINSVYQYRRRDRMPTGIRKDVIDVILAGGSKEA